VVIEVEDNGPGVLDDHSTRIWDAFWTTKDEGEGTGLGLSVAHSIIAEHGGSIVLERPAGGGARFVVRLPMANSTTEVNAVDHAVRPLDVLVIDPLVEDAEFVERFLTSRGHAVVRATSVDVAVKLATHAAFDVILCDAPIQAKDGSAALEALVATPGASRARFVLPEIRNAASDSGVAADDRSPRIASPPRTYDIEQLRRLIEGA
jgi:CheY-like chemotaxis protein